MIRKYLFYPIMALIVEPVAILIALVLSYTYPVLAIYLVNWCLRTFPDKEWYFGK
jgi:hypothetical protein